MPTIIVGAIVFGIIAYAGYRTYKNYRKKGGCGCGCSGCDKSADC